MVQWLLTQKKPSQITGSPTLRGKEKRFIWKTHELAFLPDLSEEVPIELDYDVVNVKRSAHTPEQATRLAELLKRNEKILISSGNALPPLAYGVVCDTDVGDHPSIKRRAGRVALKSLKPLYAMLKGLLRAKLVSFLKSPWTSLCDRPQEERCGYQTVYRLHAITMAMEYAMPLVDGLLSKLEKYLYFCSLDAASDVWAAMMTSRAWRISAFLRMPFGLEKALMIYQPKIDNAFQSEDGLSSLEGAITQRQSRGGDLTQLPSSLTKFALDNRALAELDPLQELIDSPEGDIFTSGEPDQ
ncbi:Hypothetical protein PHPALM_36254 [Phytophthora palmivora]|uniref:Reverse transcriptase n=1 Tax=Phytophthora palmivora TaxID=4796 RepID=A0A2P4X0E6_9STRA|nr:Hypothetical protein PHPALM_36254 [Phytophthora palmivora]